jgi:hypothetical protein
VSFLRRRSVLVGRLSPVVLLLVWLLWLLRAVAGCRSRRLAARLVLFPRRRRLAVSLALGLGLGLLSRLRLGLAFPALFVSLLVSLLRRGCLLSAGAGLLLLLSRLVSCPCSSSWSLRVALLLRGIFFWNLLPYSVLPCYNVIRN